ncbi:MAG: DNA-processing protein DprA [Elainellaceae cyanobacterium]
MQSKDDRAFWLAWSEIPGIGAILLRRLHQHFGSLANAWEASSAELEAVEGVGWQTAEAVSRERRRYDPPALLYKHEQKNPQFWTPADPEYPSLLLEIADPPALLYYRGTIDRLENQGIIPSIAIVGTRHPSDYGKRWTRKLSTALVEAGFTVVSGLANGVDTEAHQSALIAGGRTIAVLGTGVDVIYPWSNRQLAQQIEKHGLLLSEHPAGTQPDRTHFPRRNRIIAGLCRATLVIEAPEKSGSLITARLANEYSRDVYALPGSLDNPRSKGCLALLNQGAQVILGEEELLACLGLLPQLAHHLAVPANSSGQLSFWAEGLSGSTSKELSPQTADLSPQTVTRSTISISTEAQQVFQAVHLEPTTLDQIVQQTGLPTARILSSLSELELLGLVSLLPGMRYQKG